MSAAPIYRMAALDKAKLVRLNARPGQRILGVRGTLWVTQEHCTRDWIIGQGQTLEVETEGIVLLNAVGGPAAFAYEAGAILQRVGDRSPVARPAPGPLAVAFSAVRPRMSPEQSRGRWRAIEAGARRMQAQALVTLIRHGWRSLRELAARARDRAPGRRTDRTYPA